MRFRELYHVNCFITYFLKIQTYDIFLQYLDYYPNKIVKKNNIDKRNGNVENSEADKYKKFI